MVKRPVHTWKIVGSTPTIGYKVNTLINNLYFMFFNKRVTWIIAAILISILVSRTLIAINSHTTVLYLLTRELHYRDIFINNDLLFLVHNSKITPITPKFSQPTTEVCLNNTLNSVEFLVDNSSVLVSDLTNTKPLTYIGLPVNKNLR